MLVHYFVIFCKRKKKLFDFVLNRLEYEQQRLLDHIEMLVNTFDAQLRILRHEKFFVDIVMKNADLRFAPQNYFIIILRLKMLSKDCYFLVCLFLNALLICKMLRVIFAHFVH